MPAKKDMFGDIEFYQAKKKAKERLDRILTDLQKTVERNSYAVQTAQRFRGCLENPHLGDVTRLPVYSSTTYSRKRNRVQAILYTISCAVQIYWKFCNADSVNQEVKEQLDDFLSMLENYAEKGLKSFKIVESEFPKGYYLEEVK